MLDLALIMIQLLLKSLNTPADVLSQLCQSISLILRLYACSTSTILIASVQKAQKMQVRIFDNERMTNQKKAMGITLPIHETTFHTCIQTFEQ